MIYVKSSPRGQRRRVKIVRVSPGHAGYVDILYHPFNPATGTGHVAISELHATGGQKEIARAVRRKVKEGGR